MLIPFSSVYIHICIHMRTCLSPSVLSHFHTTAYPSLRRKEVSAISSLNGARFRVRVRTTLVCVSPGQVNVLTRRSRRERRAAREKKGQTREKEGETRSSRYCVSLPPPRWMHSPSLCAMRRERVRASRRRSLQHPRALLHPRSPLYYSIIAHTLPPTWREVIILFWNLNARGEMSL